jgi:hypothetical protein
VNGEQHGCRQRLDQIHQRAQAGGIIDVAGAVRAQQHVGAGHQPVLRQRLRVGARRGLAAHRDVDHHVADERHRPEHRLGTQVCHRRARRAQQQIAEVVGEHAVELLRHAVVERAHAGLDVNDRHARLGRRQAARERRVGVAVHEHGVRRELAEQRLERSQHAGRLLAVAAAADRKLAVRARETELGEEHARERVVVVLTGVHEDLLVPLTKRARNGRGLDELRTVADDCQDLHTLSL